MSVLHGAAVHFVKRGVDAVRNGEVAQLKQHAAAFTSQDLEDLKPEKFWPVLLTFVVMLFICVSIDYTVGNVMTTLAMIESPSSAAVITLTDDAPPAYTDEPDAPIEKKDLSADLPGEVDVEVNIVSQEPVTNSIRATKALLHRTGGFSARWRGYRASIFYFGLHALARNLLVAIMRPSNATYIVLAPLAYTISSLLVARMHLIWTHAMIVAPSSKSWYQRLPTLKQSRAIFMPTLVCSVAQQLIFGVPVFIFFAFGIADSFDFYAREGNDISTVAIVGLFLRLLLVPLSALLVAVFVALPAKATLVRIEATLLPAGESTIVTFDRSGIVGDLDTSSCRSHRALFVSAWRSFDRAALRRVVKMQIKNQLIQVGVLFVFAHVMLAEVFVLGGAKLALLIKSALAKAQLEIIAHAQTLEPVYDN